MTDPASSMTLGGLAGAISGATLALLGVDYYSLLWALVGAMLALGQSAAMTRGRAVVYVILSTLIGAALGSAAVVLAGQGHRALLILASVVAGAGAQLLVGAILQAALQRIAALGRIANAPVPATEADPGAKP